ncbi:MAG: right-handed parallel beta-helix repeat-containing protein [Candidatus Schekmanbacteria bacterium]|nr:right-handed parallel beta-helix repeat-containing protein [Candidatus Schekmanbacteria bacterium]
MKVFKVKKHILFISVLVIAGIIICCNQGAASDDRQSANGKVYYISKSGKDSNTGTFKKPWKTIQHAADKLTAGDTLYIRKGIYKERVVPKNSGESGKFIVYSSYKGEKVTIDGKNVNLPPTGEYGDLFGLFEISGKSYIKVNRLRVVNALTNAGSNGILLSDSDNIIISNNYVGNTQSSGIGVWNCQNMTLTGNEINKACKGGQQESISVAGTDTFEIKNNKVHHTNTKADKEGICVKDGSSNGKVYNNLIYKVPAAGIYVDAWDKHTYGIEVFGNVVHGISNSDGIQAASEMGGLLEDIKFYNNISYNNKYRGITITRNGDEGGSHPMKNISIINNTFYNNGDDWGGGAAMDNTEAEDVVIRNNICSQNRSFEISVSSDVPVQNTAVENNLLYSYKSDLEDGEVTGIDFVEGDPLFINPAKGNFHLKDTSPAIDKGSSVDAPEYDFDGNTRPQNGKYDIGAFEK